VARARREAEIAALRAVEREIDLNNRIADSVVYLLQAETEIDNAVLMRAYRHAIDRFKSEALPAHIRAMVDATVVREVMARRKAAAAPRPQRGMGNGGRNRRLGLSFA